MTRNSHDTYSNFAAEQSGVENGRTGFTVAEQKEHEVNSCAATQRTNCPQLGRDAGHEHARTRHAPEIKAGHPETNGNSRKLLDNSRLSISSASAVRHVPAGGWLMRRLKESQLTTPQRTPEREILNRPTPPFKSEPRHADRPGGYRVHFSPLLQRTLERSPAGLQHI